MKHPSFSAAIVIAIVSVILFSGQLIRPGGPLQQRQPAQVQQRQVAPQRPATPPPQPEETVPGSRTERTERTEMPSFFLFPEDIEFPDAPPGASRTITLFGNPRAEGLYVTRTLIPKGTQTIPHTHPDSRTVTVLSGVCYYGRGEVFDESRVVAFPPGSFFTEPAGVPHFIWAKEGDVIVQTTAIGPSGTQIIPAR